MKASVPRPVGRSRSLVAGVGNVLRGDDGFGPAVVRELERADALPESVRVVEVGIGGMSLVHELMAGYERLVIVDAVDRSGVAGTLYVIEPEIPDVPAAATGDTRKALTADLHEIVPERVLVLARALGVLPEVVWIVGCQPASTDELSLELSPTVARSVEGAVDAVLELVGDPGAGARRPEHPREAPRGG